MTFMKLDVTVTSLGNKKVVINHSLCHLSSETQYTLKKKVLQGFFAVVMVLYSTTKNLLSPVWFFSGSSVVLCGG